MTDRDLALLALRPEIPTEPASGVEGFLHQTLRPILKLQNATILALVASNVHTRVSGFASFAPEDQRQRLTAMVKQDSRLKSLLQGVVWGMMTSGELAFAQEHAAEVRRRIVALLAERIASQTDSIAGLVREASDSASNA